MGWLTGLFLDLVTVKIIDHPYRGECRSQAPPGEDLPIERRFASVPLQGSSIDELLDIWGHLGFDG